MENFIIWMKAASWQKGGILLVVSGVFYPIHDGTYGAAFENGWYWIDGYCYYNAYLVKQYQPPDCFVSQV